MEERVKEKLTTTTLILTLQSLVKQIETLTDRLEQLIGKNAEAFRLAGEDFTRRIIEEEVKRQVEKEKKILQYKNNKRYGRGC